MLEDDEISKYNQTLLTFLEQRYILPIAITL